MPRLKLAVMLWLERFPRANGHVLCWPVVVRIESAPAPIATL